MRRRTAHAAAAIAGGGALLLWPAFLNGYPLVFSDTGAFLAQTAAAAPGLGQAGGLRAAAARLPLAPLACGPRRRRRRCSCPGCCGAPGGCSGGGPRPGARTCCWWPRSAPCTAAPWFASLLMPDALAPALVLAVALLGWGDPRPWERAGLLLVVALAAAAHLAHLPLLGRAAPGAGGGAAVAGPARRRGGAGSRRWRWWSRPTRRSRAGPPFRPMARSSPWRGWSRTGRRRARSRRGARRRAGTSAAGPGGCRRTPTSSCGRRTDRSGRRGRMGRVAARADRPGAGSRGHPARDAGARAVGRAARRRREHRPATARGAHRRHAGAGAPRGQRVARALARSFPAAERRRFAASLQFRGALPAVAAPFLLAAPARAAGGRARAAADVPARVAGRRRARCSASCSASAVGVLANAAVLGRAQRTARPLRRAHGVAAAAGRAAGVARPSRRGSPPRADGRRSRMPGAPRRDPGLRPGRRAAGLRHLRRSAGLVKGVAGFGLPTLGIGLLVLSRPLPEAMALMLLPTIATNVWQAVAGGALRATLRRLRWFLLAAAAGTLLAAGNISKANAAVLTGLLGALLVVSSSLALLGPRWPVPSPDAGAVALAGDGRYLRRAGGADRQLHHPGRALAGGAAAAAGRVRAGLRPRRGGGDGLPRGGAGRARTAAAGAGPRLRCGAPADLRAAWRSGAGCAGACRKRGSGRWCSAPCWCWAPTWRRGPSARNRAPPGAECGQNRKPKFARTPERFSPNR